MGQIGQWILPEEKCQICPTHCRSLQFPLFCGHKERCAYEIPHVSETDGFNIVSFESTRKGRGGGDYSTARNKGLLCTRHARRGGGKSAPPSLGNLPVSHSSTQGKYSPLIALISLDVVQVRSFSHGKNFALNFASSI